MFQTEREKGKGIRTGNCSLKWITVSDMLLQFKDWPKKYFLEFNFPKKFRSGVTIPFF